MAFKTDERYKISKCYDHELLQASHDATISLPRGGWIILLLGTLFFFVFLDFYFADRAYLERKSATWL